jgi:MPBQ/MSBQ methyltransferase
MPIPFLFVAILILVFVVAAYLLRASLRAPSHRYEGRDSVSEVYDRWTKGRVTEYYWGEHLHAGYYGNPPVKKDFVQAKVDFIDEMIAWGGVWKPPSRVPASSGCGCWMLVAGSGAVCAT